MRINADTGHSLALEVELNFIIEHVYESTKARIHMDWYIASKRNLTSRFNVVHHSVREIRRTQNQPCYVLAAIPVYALSQLNQIYFLRFLVTWHSHDSRICQVTRFVKREVPILGN